MDKKFPPVKSAASQHGQLQVNSDNLRKSIFFQKIFFKTHPNHPPPQYIYKHLLMHNTPLEMVWSCPAAFIGGEVVAEFFVRNLMGKHVLTDPPITAFTAPSELLLVCLITGCLVNPQNQTGHWFSCSTGANAVGMLPMTTGTVVGGLLAWCLWGWHQLEATPMGIRRPR